MAIFGRKNNKDNDKDKENQAQLSAEENDLDAMIMAAIEETDEEEQQRKEDARKAHEAMLEANRAAHEREEAARKAMADLPNEGRRFYLLVEEIEGPDEEGRLVAIGNIHGECHVGDSLFVYRPNGTVLSCKLENIKAMGGENAPDSDKKQRASITLSSDLTKDNKESADKLIPRFSVVSGVERRNGKPAGTPVDNPALVGATLEYKEFQGQRDYMSVLISHMSAASYLVPVNPEAGGTTEDGKRKIGFMLLKTNKSEANGASGAAVPLFTDPVAMSQWKDLYADGKKPSVIVATLADITKVTSKAAPDLMINAFGPVPVHLPRKLADSINEARAKAARNVLMQKQTIKKKEAARIMVNEPVEGPETDAVRKALKECAAGIPSVNSLGLLGKLQDGKRSFLVIVDCPKDGAPEIFKRLFAAAKPHLTATKSVDFSLYSETIFADDYFEKHSLDYVRIGNL